MRRPLWVSTLAVIAIVNASPVLGESIEGPSTEIVVVGTVHAATPNYSAKDLIRILQKVRPDVILFEYPADMMTPTFEFKSVDEGSLEQQAVLEYVEQADAEIRPYDIDGRNRYYESTNYFARERQCYQEMGELLGSQDLSIEARRIIADIEAAFARRDTLGRSDPATINSYQADTEINEKQWLMYQGIPEIVRVTPELRDCEDFWNLSRAYWAHRNSEMLANIRRYASEFSGQRLVVLCGFEHRYFLRSHLYDWNEPPAYIIKEYWEY
ncbi:MAG: hypothetical protein ABIK96_10780 [bacterium]